MPQATCLKASIGFAAFVPNGPEVTLDGTKVLPARYLLLWTTSVLRRIVESGNGYQGKSLVDRK